MQAIFLSENQSFNSLQSESTFVITFAFKRVQKLKCIIFFRLSTASGHPLSVIVINKTVTSSNNCGFNSVFEFNSAKYDINLIKSFLLPILVNEQVIEPTVLKKSQSVWFFQFWRHSITWHYEFPRWCHQSWLFPQSLLDQRDKSLLSLRKIRWFRENEQQRNSSLWLLL